MPPAVHLDPPVALRHRGPRPIRCLVRLVLWRALPSGFRLFIPSPSRSAFRALSAFAFCRGSHSGIQGDDQHRPALSWSPSPSHSVVDLQRQRRDHPPRHSWPLSQSCRFSCPRKKLGPIASGVAAAILARPAAGVLEGYAALTMPGIIALVIVMIPNRPVITSPPKLVGGKTHHDANAIQVQFGKARTGHWARGPACGGGGGPFFGGKKGAKKPPW